MTWENVCEDCSAATPEGGEALGLRELTKFQGLGSSRNLRGSESYKIHGGLHQEYTGSQLLGEGAAHKLSRELQRCSFHGHSPMIGRAFRFLMMQLLLHHPSSRMSVTLNCDL